jgi:fructose-bisphosphate aldolase, class II
MSLHLDHAQDEEIIRKAADMPGCPFDSIMVDMSHYEKEENLEKTKILTEYCHTRGIATEAEPGRMEGGEDGVQDTGDLEGVLTTPEEAMKFVNTGIDILVSFLRSVIAKSPLLTWDIVGSSIRKHPWQLWRRRKHEDGLSTVSLFESTRFQS